MSKPKHYAFDQKVFLIEVTHIPAGDKIQIQRTVSPDRYIVRDALYSLVTGSISYMLLKVGAECVYDLRLVSGNLVWATEAEALRMIADLNSFCSEGPADECGCDPKCSNPRR